MNSLTNDSVRRVLREVYDPEFGVSVEDLGLIYDVAIEDSRVSVAMTLTTPSCPASTVMTEGVRTAIASMPGVASVQVELVWDPRWTPEMLSAAAREQLGWRDSA